MSLVTVASIDTSGEREYDKRRSIHLSGSYSLPNINHTAGSDQPLTEGINMIDFEIVINGKTKYVSWAKLCQFTGVKRYQPGTPELAQLKREFEKKWNADSVTVRLNKQPIL